MERWKKVEAELTDYRSFLAPKYQQIRIVEGYDLDWEKAHAIEAEKTIPKDDCGVYLIYDEAENLLYVGKSIVSFDSRIWLHNHIIGARYIDLICFNSRNAALLLALEYFLICRLKPTWNTHYKEYDVPPEVSA